MSKITKQDTNGVKPLLGIGELGYDNYPAGGDKGRVYVGTGHENIALAKKVEVTAVDTKVNTHTAKVDNPHSVTKAQVGLGNVDNTSDANKPISTATQTALSLKANAANAALTGVPTAPTATVGTNTTQLATTAFVNSEITDKAPTKTGTGASGTWGINVTGNSATATKLQTARTINGVAFDGTANIVAPTNLTVGTRTATAVPIESSTGTNASIPAVTTSLAGVMSSADKVKLDGIAAGAQVNVATNLGIIAGTTAGPIVTSSTGTNTILPTASASASGVVTTGDQTIAGTKTFSSSPIVPTPTTGTQVVNKAYADLKVAKTEVAYNVSTSSFIPNTLASGAIIERGSNANGEYTKFADGTLICSTKIDLPYVNANYLEKSWVFPSAFFSSTYNVQVIYRGNAANQINWPSPYRAHTGYASSSTTSTLVSLYPPHGVTWATNSAATDVSALAIGRWK